LDGRLTTAGEIISTIGRIFNAFENCFFELIETGDPLYAESEPRSYGSPGDDLFMNGGILKLQLKTAGPFLPKPIIEQLDLFYSSMVDSHLSLAAGMLVEQKSKEMFMDIYKLEHQFDLIVSMMQEDLGIGVTLVKERSFGVINSN
jgi:hypothetical protein